MYENPGGGTALPCPPLPTPMTASIRFFKRVAITLVELPQELAAGLSNPLNYRSKSACFKID